MFQKSLKCAFLLIFQGLDQEQGPEESQSEANTLAMDPLVGFTIKDIKAVLDQVTDDIVIGIQVLTLDSVLTYFIITG